LSVGKEAFTAFRASRVDQTPDTDALGVSTIIPGLRNLNGWTGVAFALVAVTTVVGALEPYIA
jgi:hypothetical protein